MRILLMAAVVLLALTDASMAERKRGSEVGIDDCLMGNTTDKECDGDLCYCCYDDGCWICGFDENGNGYMDCVWDGTYSSARHPKPRPPLKWQGQAVGKEKLQMSPEPDPAPNPKLKVVPLKKPRTLAPLVQ